VCELLHDLHCFFGGTGFEGGEPLPEVGETAHHPIAECGVSAGTEPFDTCNARFIPDLIEEQPPAPKSREVDSRLACGSRHPVDPRRDADTSVVAAIVSCTLPKLIGEAFDAIILPAQRNEMPVDGIRIE
jgi:hypothetical protein